MTIHYVYIDVRGEGLAESDGAVVGCRITPSEPIREYVEAALAAASGSETVTVRLADLHRAIDNAVQRDAARPFLEFPEPSTGCAWRALALRVIGYSAAGPRT